MTEQPAMTAEALTELRNALASKTFVTDDIEAVEEAIARRHRQIFNVIDPTQPWSGDNRAWIRPLVVTGRFRSGKTRSVKEAISQLGDVVGPNGVVVPLFAIRVKAPENFTVEALGRAILDRMKLMPARAIGTNRTIERLHARIRLKRPTIIHIDEAQRMLKPERVAQHRQHEETVKIFGQLRDLVELIGWPVLLVLSGTVELVRALEHEDLGFFREISDFVAIAAMSIDNENDHDDLKDALETVAEKARLKVDVSACEHFYSRLIHASNGARGFAFDFCLEAVLLAVEAGRDTVTDNDFAAFYARKTGSLSAANPFLTANWHHVDPKILLAKMTGELASRVWDATP